MSLPVIDRRFTQMIAYFLVMNSKTCTDQENKNTRAKTQRDVKLLTAFLLDKNEQRKIEEIQPEELYNHYVSEFILSVKRKDGQDYEPSSLRGLFSSFNRYLKERKYSASIIEDIVFDQA